MRVLRDMDQARLIPAHTAKYGHDTNGYAFQSPQLIENVFLSGENDNSNDSDFPALPQKQQAPVLDYRNSMNTNMSQSSSLNREQEYRRRNSPHTQTQTQSLSHKQTCKDKVELDVQCLLTFKPVFGSLAEFDRLKTSASDLSADDFADKCDREAESLCKGDASTHSSLEWAYGGKYLSGMYVM